MRPGRIVHVNTTISAEHGLHGRRGSAIFLGPGQTRNRQTEQGEQDQHRLHHGPPGIE